MDSASGSTDRIGPALVALRQPPGPAFVDALESVWARGDAVLPLAADLPEPAVSRSLAAFRPAAVRDAGGEQPLPDGEPVAPGTALVVATSGSTGTPKGVELSHAALTASATASLARLGAEPGTDRWLCCLPLAHVAGIAVLVRSRLLGTPAVVHSRFEPAAVAAADATMVALVPTMLGRLLDAGVDVGRFRAILLGGAAPPAGLLDRARAAGARVVVSYGMTETCGGCVYDGVALDGVEVGIGGGSASDDRIRVRGPVLFSGYRGRPGTGPDGDGWFVTSDRGRWTPDGRLAVLGRADDIIVTGGHNVAAGAVAALLREHPAVAEAVVTGQHDAEWGQRVVATVVAADPGRPPGLDELRAFVAGRAAPYAAPRELHVVPELARSALGKPLGGSPAPPNG